MFSRNTLIMCTQATNSPQKVFTRMSNLDPDKGPGPDTVPARFSKECNRVLWEPSSILFSHSLKCGIVSKRWKVLSITSVYKSRQK